MKMKKEDFDFLKAEIEKTLLKHNSKGELVRDYEAGKFCRSEKVKDLQKRFCFDVLFGAGVEKFVTETLYKYLTDDHIYTALKQICPVVTRKY